MNSLTRLTPVLLVLPFLAGCPGPLTRLAAENTRLANVPGSLKQACAGVVDIPPRALSSAEAARLWGQDRQRLGDCRRRHAALAAAVTAIEGQGEGQGHE